MSIFGIVCIVGIIIGVILVVIGRKIESMRVGNIGVVICIVAFLAITTRAAIRELTSEADRTNESLATEITQSVVGTVQTDPITINGTFGTVIVQWTPEGTRGIAERKVLVALHDGIKAGDQVRLDWIFGGDAFNRIQMVTATKTVKTAGGR